MSGPTNLIILKALEKHARKEMQQLRRQVVELMAEVDDLEPYRNSHEMESGFDFPDGRACCSTHAWKRKATNAQAAIDRLLALCDEADQEYAKQNHLLLTDEIRAAVYPDRAGEDK